MVLTTSLSLTAPLQTLEKMPLSFFAFSLLTVFCTSLTSLSSSPLPSPTPPLPPSSPVLEFGMGCATMLLSFSPCLPYISAPPNNASNSAPRRCCEIYASTIDAGSAFCLCYILREPSMLGFPMNITRILLLSSVCPLRNASLLHLDSFCSGMQALPPLASNAAGPLDQSDGSPHSSPSPSMSLTPQSAEVPTPIHTSSFQVSEALGIKMNGSSSWFLLLLLGTFHSLK